MSEPTLGTISLMVATLTMGLAAGVFVLYAHTVMRGLARTDDRTFVTAFQEIDRAIINPWFMVGAFGGAFTEGRSCRRSRLLSSTGVGPRSRGSRLPSCSRWWSLP